jgi:hypothetical protein
MRFIGLDLIAHAPDGDPTERLSQTVANAVLLEELGFDGRRKPAVAAGPGRVPLALNVKDVCFWLRLAAEYGRFPYNRAHFLHVNPGVLVALPVMGVFHAGEQVMRLTESRPEGGRSGVRSIGEDRSAGRGVTERRRADRHVGAIGVG